MSETTPPKARAVSKAGRAALILLALFWGAVIFYMVRSSANLTAADTATSAGAGIFGSAPGLPLGVAALALGLTLRRLWRLVAQGRGNGQDDRRP